MRIVILGAGLVGTFLAKELSVDNDVIVVEKDKEKALWVRDNYDVLSIEGSGEDPVVLKEIELEKADVLLAVTGEDEVNLLCTMYAHHLGVKNIVLRIRNTNYKEYINVLHDPNVSIVSPGDIISEKLINLISAPFAWSAETFADNRVELFKLKVEENTEIAGKKLSELGPAKSWIFVGVIKGKKGSKIEIPTGDTVLEPGDYVYALGDPWVMQKLKKLFGLKEERIRSAMIVGAGRLGRKAALRLSERGVKVSIIDNDENRARLATEEVPNASVYLGDATDKETLLEAGVESVDYFIALTGDDEKNVFSALLAKNFGVRRTAVLYNKPGYISVLEAIGIDRAVNVRLAVANEILSVLHVGGIVHISTVEEGKGEIIEFDIKKDSKILGKPLKEIHFPKGSMVGVCIRDGKIIIPKGNFVPEVGDRLIVFALPEAVRKVEEILG